jgi:2-C-methyl-D-erythritol 4-phosphate cytidylyltransferase/2-C-methyl-D-erythritol 2,4-cyclodiphosphate synthase
LPAFYAQIVERAIALTLHRHDCARKTTFRSTNKGALVRTAAIIVAAGKGTRVGGDVPKQFQMLDGLPVLVRSIRAFTSLSQVDRVLVVIGADERALYREKIMPWVDSQKIEVIIGGAERSQSVLNGLAALERSETDMVLIHDGARPLVSRDLILRVIDAVKSHQAAAPAIAVSDTLWRGDARQVTKTTRRDGLFRAQTPQGFKLRDILAAHNAYIGVATDDVEVALAVGMTVQIVEGDEDNIKITQPADFARSRRILGGQMDIRTGNGFDVHAFEPGDHVVLCGIKIPHIATLKGHSDADVAMHAITDAIYGALAAGDIGAWFPPTDAKWKNAASDIFLRHAGKMACDQGFTITHVDCTLICEQPKIGPHSAAMRTRLAEILEIETTRVSVKATTSERLGFTGRSEGIAAMATATLVRL